MKRLATKFRSFGIAGRSLETAQRTPRMHAARARDETSGVATQSVSSAKASHGYDKRGFQPPLLRLLCAPLPALRGRTLRIAPVRARGHCMRSPRVDMPPALRRFTSAVFVRALAAD